MIYLSLTNIVKTLSSTFILSQLPTYHLSLSKGILKAFLHRAHTIYSTKYINQEVQILIVMFVKNGHSRQFLGNLVYEYQNMNKKNSKNKSFKNIKNLPWIPISEQNWGFTISFELKMTSLPKINHFMSKVTLPYALK